MSSFCEFQVVVLTEAGCSGLERWQGGGPRALVSVAGRPLIWYCLTSLHASGFTDVIVAVNACDLDAIKTAVLSFAPAEKSADTAKQQKTNQPLYLSEVTIGNVFGSLNVLLVVLPRDLKSHLEFVEENVKDTSKNTDASHDAEDGDTADAAANYNEDTTLGTAEILHLLRPKLTTDVVIVSCDTIGTINYQALMDMHRVRNSTCTLLCVNQAVKRQQKESNVVAQQGCSWLLLDADKQERVVVSIKDAGRVALGTDLKVDKYQLFRHPNCVLKTNILDAHIYILRHSVLQLLDDEKLGIESIKQELVPFLAKMQATPQAAAWATSRLDCDDFSQRLWKMCPWQSDTKNLAMDSQSNKFNASSAPNVPSGTSVNAYFQDAQHENAIRVTDADILTSLNLMFCNPKAAETRALLPAAYNVPLSTVFKECIVGERLAVDSVKGPIIKRSVIGSDVVIKDSARITNCVIGNGVVIGRETMLQGCAVGNGAVIEAHCKLSSCRVGRKVVVTKGKEMKGEDILGTEIDLAQI